MSSKTLTLLLLALEPGMRCGTPYQIVSLGIFHPSLPACLSEVRDVLYTFIYPFGLSELSMACAFLPFVGSHGSYQRLKASLGMAVSTISPVGSEADHDADAEGAFFVASLGAKRVFKRSHRRALCCLCFVVIALVLLLTAWTSAPASTTDHIKHVIGNALPLSSVARDPSAPLIPPHVWQIYIQPPNHTPDAELFRDTLTWHATNPHHQYTMLGSAGLDAFVARHFAGRPDIVSIFQSLKITILKADFARYLLLDAAGGVYADLDTRAQRPITEWVPPELRNATRAIVGIEYDQRDDEQFDRMPRPLMFCQYAMAAAPGHGLVRRAADAVAQNLQRLAAHQGAADVAGLGRPTTDDVYFTTGPPAWSAAVMAELDAQAGRALDWRELSGLTAPRLVGDVLVLPINAFGAGQVHSGSSREAFVAEALVRHRFAGSWWEQTDQSTGDTATERED